MRDRPRMRDLGEMRERSRAEWHEGGGEGRAALRGERGESIKKEDRDEEEGRRGVSKP